ncbi:MAG: extracellular solute-binding protein, partial [Ruminococcus sp.]|nr:extracellular solute-binding protein [Ruminococcus sp.]
IEKLGGSYGSEAAVLENTAVILDKCVKKPVEIPSYLARIKDSITSLSAWMRECREQPLEIDYIEFASADRKFTSCKRKIMKSAKFSFKAFISSFFQDYTTLSDITGETAIEVWVALGRDQAEIVRDMTESQFIPEYGIPVSVNLVNGGVVEAALAGKAPDAALFLGGEFPVNLASRGLLTDFSQYDDFGEMSQRFGESAMVQYSWDGGCYGIPISRSFPMMFYRTDILSELGYDHPPETWDELMKMLPAIQRNYMNAGLVLPPNNISPATEAGHTFAMLMLQNGKSYYNDDLTATSFDSVEAYRCFEQWTDFYAKYSFEQSYDAFSRFRTGEYPIVIANYTFFNQLEEASPEIRGLWDFCQVPGTLRADGTVSHAVNSSGSGAVVFSSAENQEGAWEFVKWFTSTEVQTELGMRLEGLNGVMGRFDTADPQALRQLSWSEEELSRLMDQYEELAEIPIIPSSYAVTRNIMNAFREVVNDGENPRDTLLWYNRDINDEIERKNEVMNKRGG